VNTQCGVGVNLFKASYVVFVEAPWNPSILDQCISRCDRVGQTEVVRTDILTVHKSIDAHVLHHILTKDEIIESIITTSGDEDMSSTKFTGLDKALLRTVEFRAEELGLDLADWVIGASHDKHAEETPADPVQETEKPKAKKKVAKKVAPKPVPEPEPEPEPEEATLTIEDVRIAVRAYIDTEGGPATRKLLKEFGADKLSDITEDRYEELLLAIETATNE
jgi:hypothetical protein